MSRQSPADSRHGSGPPTARVPVNIWFLAAAVSMATFMEVLDTSIANVALPHIAGSMAASLDEATWVLTTYLVANVIILPISGWISDTVGRKRFFLFALTLFTGSSLLCGLAPNLRLLIFFRVLQGLGGGGLAPVSLAILVDTFPLRKRGMAMAVYGITVLVAPILGPVAGGWITDHYSWRWIFFINLPVGLTAIILNSILLKETVSLAGRGDLWRKLSRIDFLGLMLLAVGLGSLEIIYDRGNRLDWFQSSFIVGLSITVVVSLAAAVLWELNHPRPIVNLRLFADRNFLACGMIFFMVFATLYGSTVLLPLLLQTLMNYSATYAGLILSPGGIATMIMMPVAGWLMGRGTDARWLILLALLVMAGALYWMTGLTLDVSPWYLVKLRIVQTIALAFFFVPIQSAAYLYLPQRQINNATAMVSMLRNEGASLGIAILNTVLARRAQFHQWRLGEHVNKLSHATTEALAQATRLAEAAGAGPDAARHQALGLLSREVQRQAIMMAYLDAFLIFALMALAIVPLLLLMRRSVTEGD